MPAHRMAEDPGSERVDREMRRDDAGQFLREVAVHPEMIRPGLTRGVDVEACALAEIPVVGRPLDAGVARACIRCDQYKTERGGDALRACLDREYLFIAGQAGQVVKDRQAVASRMRRHELREAHRCAAGARFVGIKTLAAAKAVM